MPTEQAIARRLPLQMQMQWPGRRDRPRPRCRSLSWSVGFTFFMHALILPPILPSAARNTTVAPVPLFFVWIIPRSDSWETQPHVLVHGIFRPWLRHRPFCLCLGPCLVLGSRHDATQSLLSISSTRATAYLDQHKGVLQPLVA